MGPRIPKESSGNTGSTGMILSCSSSATDQLHSWDLTHSSCHPLTLGTSALALSSVVFSSKSQMHSSTSHFLTSLTPDNHSIPLLSFQKTLRTALVFLPPIVSEIYLTPFYPHSHHWSKSTSSLAQTTAVFLFSHVPAEYPLSTDKYFKSM